MNHIGYNIKRIKELSGISSDALASKLGKTASAIEKIETYKRGIDLKNLEKIADALGVTVEDIRNFDEKTFFPNTEKVEQLITEASSDYISRLDKIVTLYERLLESERAKCALLQKMLDNTLSKLAAKG